MGWQELIALLIAAACGYSALRSFRASWKGQGGCAKCPAGKPKPVGIREIRLLQKNGDPARGQENDHAFPHSNPLPVGKEAGKRPVSLAKK